VRDHAKRRHNGKKTVTDTEHSDTALSSCPRKVGGADKKKKPTKQNRGQRNESFDCARPLPMETGGVRRACPFQAFARHPFATQLTRPSLTPLPSPREALRDARLFLYGSTWTVRTKIEGGKTVRNGNAVSRSGSPG